MRKTKHTHQYHKVYPHGLGVTTLGRVRGVWACALSDCTHYMPYNVANQVIGKASLCNRCMEPFILDEENMKNDKPICYVCAHPENVVVVPESFNYEYHEARSKIAEKTGRALADIPDEEVERMVQLRRLAMMDAGREKRRTKKENDNE